MKIRNAAWLLVALIASGCEERGMVGDETHTWYLEPDGAVVWSIVEEDQRSVDPTQAERDEDEARFLSERLASEHEFAQDLRKLGSLDVNTRVVRSKRPFTVCTEARFDDLQLLFNGLSRAWDLPDSLVQVNVGERSFTVTYDFSRVDELSEAEQQSNDDAIDLPWPERIVLPAGHFTDAVGFTLSQDRTFAYPVELDLLKLAEQGGVFVYSLSWSVE